MSHTDEILTARHPAPVRFLPRRGRIERMAYAQVESPVRVRRIPASAMEGRYQVQPSPESVVDVALVEGRPFVRVKTLSLQDLAAYLDCQASGLYAGLRSGPLACAFAGTPLSALAPMYDDRGQYRPEYQQDFRGHPDALANAGAVTHDGTEAARRDIQDFFERRVRYVDGAILVDTGGPMVRQVHPSDRKGVPYVVTGTPSLRVYDDRPLARLTMAEAMQGKGWDGRGRSRPLFRGCELPPDFHGKGDPALDYANMVPRHVVNAIGHLLRGAPREALADPALREAASKVYWMALRGGVGGIHADEIDATLARVSATAKAMRPWIRDQEYRADMGQVMVQCRQIREALGEARARSVPDEDLESMAGLSA